MILGIVVGFFTGCICGVCLTALLVGWKKNEEHISSL